MSTKVMRLLRIKLLVQEAKNLRGGYQMRKLSEIEQLLQDMLDEEKASVEAVS